MPWKCNNCGHENTNPGVCAACGEIKFGSLNIISETTGRNITANVETSIGKHLLTRLEDPDAQFASELQFQIIKSTELAGWAIIHNVKAKNPTFLNGTALGSMPQLLATGNFISIGLERMNLRVEIS